MSAHGHAVVVGGSVAGLLAARVASDHFETVTILDRDVLVDEAAPRRAAPQSRHIHALLARGQQILEGLFPGLTHELQTAGAPVGDFGTSLSWYFGGRMIRKTPTGMTCVAAGRPLLEQRIRRRVSRLPNVRVVDDCEVIGLRLDRGGNRVTGVKLLRPAEADGRSDLDADLVVDAAGRGSRLPAWLDVLDFPSVGREIVKVGLGYVTWYFDSLPDFDPLGPDIALVPVATPDSPRGAIFARLPGRYGLALTGLRGDHPPREHASFLAYAASLPVPEIHRAVASAEPSGPPSVFHYPASVRHRYERMSRFPEGVIALGDSFSTFNPTYGQGMTVSAMAAELLRRHLERDGGLRSADFLRDLGKVVDAPWALAVGADLGFKETEGRRTLGSALGNAYIPRLQRAAAKDPVLSRAFLRVAGLVDPPSTLFRPAIVARTLTA